MPPHDPLDAMVNYTSDFRELRLDHLSRDFGTHNALKNVSLTIQKGEFVALLGPSGCGKSTTLNLIAGLLPATGGSIWLDNKRIDPLRPEERGFGMVFQNYALFPHMNVRRNIGFGLKMRGVDKSEIERRVNEAVNLVRLQSQVDKLPGQLSGGQQQRVAIARAIVVEPALVLMDEPLSNLDAKLRLVMRAEIRRIHNTLGTTTIYVTHDQEEALSLADRIVVLRDGQIRQVGTPEDLFTRPDHLDVAEFMGFRNIVSGFVSKSQRGLVEVSVGNEIVEGITRNSFVNGDPCSIAIRPEDLHPVQLGAGGLSGKVISTEFRGREFVGFARMEDGTNLSFLAHDKLEPGSSVTLGAEPNRVIVFADQNHL